MYKIKYTYNNPSNAGPFKGSSETCDKYTKGDWYPAVFGNATVVSCSKVRKPITRDFQQVCDDQLNRR